jgi:hypothetical protein
MTTSRARTELALHAASQQLADLGDGRGYRVAVEADLVALGGATTL